MSAQRKNLIFTVIIVALVAAAFAMPVLARISTQEPSQAGREGQRPAACTLLGKPSDLPSPALINFDDLKDSDVIGDRYKATFGVSFEDSAVTQAIIYGNEPLKAASPPNVAINNAVRGTSNNVPMVLNFQNPVSHVGFYIGNSENTQIVGLLTALDAGGKVICQFRITPVPEPATRFVGIFDPSGAMVQVTLDYGDTALNETIDDLYIAPRGGLPAGRQPLPKWTPVPNPRPTAGPPPTPTPVVPMFAYAPLTVSVFQALPVPPDLSIHGLEITQGIQCFDTSKGLAGCPDNSLQVVNKKDTTARVYLKIGSPSTNLSNVRVRLFIIANGVTYQADALGIATNVIHQGSPESANIYFNVNFNNTIPVSFYAIVDPNDTIAESNESNNRYPSSGFVQLSFQNRTSLKIVGRRVDYHPSGYSGTRYAGGWAVNGGAADWFEQVLPLRNNGINYSVASGYLNWTSLLTPCGSTGAAQHSMIQGLNVEWILENVFSFWFSGAFTGADHVYGWVPNAGYPCGHADMPVYPHAGGLGVVAIGSDNPGTNTDNPGSGPLIFGHELVHDYNEKHTNTADSCGSNDTSSPFPYSSSSIQEFGFNPVTGKIYDPATTHDLMSYCPSGGSKQGWISPYTWSAMFNDLSSPVVVNEIPQGETPTYSLGPSASGQSLQVNVTINNLVPPQVGGKLDTLYQVDAGVACPACALLPGPYAVELRDAAGSTLASQTFAVNFESEYDAHGGSPGGESPPPFSYDPTSQEDLMFILPWDPGTAYVLLTHNGSVLDQKAVSANAPQVLFTDPLAAQAWLPGSTHTLVWQGLDLDGDPLDYTLFYSYDAGSTWSLLASGLTGSSYPVQTDSMAGGSDVRFRVIASDGILTGVAETDQAISIPNHAPVPTILDPLDGSHFIPGSLVVLQGIAIDMEDGTLPDGSLHWESDVQGSLGIGPSLPLNNLTPGKHVITLTAADSYNIQASTQVTIYVVFPQYLPVVRR